MLQQYLLSLVKSHVKCNKLHHNEDVHLCDHVTKSHAYALAYYTAHKKIHLLSGIYMQYLMASTIL